ncbi:Histidine kinase [Leptospira interrogans]|nr:Histidine kinase [Leptospira interrogans]
MLTHKNTNKKLQNKIFAYTEKESKLIESLNYKETLFKEIQHRVKNNIHLILGMLNLDREKAESELAKKRSNPRLIGFNRWESFKNIYF